MKKAVFLFILAIAMALPGTAFANAVIINHDYSTAIVKLDTGKGKFQNLEVGGGGQQRVLSGHLIQDLIDRGFDIRIFIDGQPGNAVEFVDGGVYEIRNNNLMRTR